MTENTTQTLIARARVIAHELLGFGLNLSHLSEGWDLNVSDYEWLADLIGRELTTDEVALVRSTFEQHVRDHFARGNR